MIAFSISLSAFSLHLFSCCFSKAHGSDPVLFNSSWTPPRGSSPVSCQSLEHPVWAPSVKVYLAKPDIQEGRMVCWKSCISAIDTRGSETSWPRRVHSMPEKKMDKGLQDAPEKVCIIYEKNFFRERVVRFSNNLLREVVWSTIPGSLQKTCGCFGIWLGVEHDGGASLMVGFDDRESFSKNLWF